MGWMGWGPHCGGRGCCWGARAHMFFLLELRQCCVHQIWVWNTSILVSPPWLQREAATL